MSGNIGQGNDHQTQPARTDSSPRGAIPKVTIIIVNWNTWSHLEHCLESLPAAVAELDADIVVVDNASTDGSVELVRERFPLVRCIALPHNVGFAAANNAALGEAVAEYALLLNPDIVAPPGSVERMVHALDEREGVSAVGAVLVGHDKRTQAEFYRRFPSRVQILLFYTLLGYAARLVAPVRRRWFEHDVTGNNAVEVDQLPGACLMVRLSTVREVGLMDPDYFIWWEDVDWCYRMRQAGHTLAVLPWVRMIHAGGSSFGAWSIDRRVSQFFRSYLRFLSKYQMEQLMRWSHHVLIADLWLKEMIVRLVQYWRIPTRTVWPRPESIRAIRKDIALVVAAHDRGELPAYSDGQWAPP